MHAASNRFWDAVACERFPPAELDFQYARLIFYQKPNSLASKPPLPRKICDAVMHFERCIGLDQMRPLVLKCCSDHGCSLPPFRGEGSDPSYGTKAAS
jgi:hypothetical protein